jgi:hypothetical protein
VQNFHYCTRHTIFPIPPSSTFVCTCTQTTITNSKDVPMGVQYEEYLLSIMEVVSGLNAVVALWIWTHLTLLHRVSFRSLKVSR